MTAGGDAHRAREEAHPLLLGCVGSDLIESVEDQGDSVALTDGLKAIDGEVLRAQLEMGLDETCFGIVLIERPQIEDQREHIALLGEEHGGKLRSEEHTSELQSLMRIPYA